MTRLPRKNKLPKQSLSPRHIICGELSTRPVEARRAPSKILGQQPPFTSNIRLLATQIPEVLEFGAEKWSSSRPGFREIHASRICRVAHSEVYFLVHELNQEGPTVHPTDTIHQHTCNVDNRPQAELSCRGDIAMEANDRMKSAYSYRERGEHPGFWDSNTHNLQVGVGDHRRGVPMIPGLKRACSS